MRRVNVGHLRVTIGHPMVTVGHSRVTIGHYREFFSINQIILYPVSCELLIHLVSH